MASIITIGGLNVQHDTERHPPLRSRSEISAERELTDYTSNRQFADWPDLESATPPLHGRRAHDADHLELALRLAREEKAARSAMMAQFSKEVFDDDGDGKLGTRWPRR